MRYAGLVKNDIVDGDDGIAVALYFPPKKIWRKLIVHATSSKTCYSFTSNSSV